MHTPASFEMKMGLGHRLYEEFRLTRDPITKLAVWDRAVGAAASVPVPEGVLELPHLTTQPQPDEIRLCAAPSALPPHCPKLARAHATACAGGATHHSVPARGAAGTPS